MDKGKLRRRYSERNQRINSVCHKFWEEQDSEGARNDLKWLEISDKLLDYEKERERRAFTFKSIPVVSLIIVLIVSLWVILNPIRSTSISLEIITKTVTLELSNDWTSNYDFISENIFINNIDILETSLQDLPRGIDPEHELTTMNLQGQKNMTLEDLRLTDGAKIEVTARDDQLNLFVKHSPLSGNIYATYGNLAIETDDKIIKIPIQSEGPETITFRTMKTLADPVRFEITTDKNWKLYGLTVKDIGFAEENPPGSGIFEFPVYSGELVLHEIGFTQKLREADCVSIGKISKNSRLEISRVEQGMKIFFEGTVEGIVAGPKGFEKDLMPNRLEWVYHQQKKPAFLIAVSVFALLMNKHKILRRWFA